MEVTEITQRGYLLNFCQSIIFFNKAKIKQQTKPKPNPKTPIQSLWPCSTLKLCRIFCKIVKYNKV